MGHSFSRTATFGINRQKSSSKNGGQRFFSLLLGLLCCLAPSVLPAALQCPSAAVNRELTAAREKLALSEHTRDRVARELQALKQSSQADPGMLRDYTTYLQRVQDLVDENRRLVRKLEALCAPAGAVSGQASPGVPSPPEGEELAALDRKLQDSLATFDEMLLKRLDAIQAESAEKMRDLAQQAAQAAERARRGGGGTGSASGTSGKTGAAGEKAREQEGSRQGSRRKDAAQGGRSGTDSAAGGKGRASTGAGTEASAPRGSGQATTATRGQTGSGGTAAPGTYNPDDDDIVARQLREAAEQETDPELKKKLWEEYEAYKKNTRP